MADFWTHYYIGEEMQKIIHEPLHRKVFLLGCQGPDFYYFLKFKVHTIPPNLGELIHKDSTREVFKKAFEFLKKNNSSLLRSYVLGWVNHFIVDKNVHPYIDSKKTYDHKRLEADIDTYILNKYMDKDIFHMKSKPILKYREELKPVYDMYKFIAKEVYQKELTIDAFKKSLRNYYLFHLVFNRRNKIYKKLLIKIGSFKGEHYENYFYLPMEEINIPEDIDTFEALMEKAKKETEDRFILIRNYLNDKDSLEKLVNSFEMKNYSGEDI